MLDSPNKLGQLNPGEMLNDSCCPTKQRILLSRNRRPQSFYILYIKLEDFIFLRIWVARARRFSADC